MRSFLLVSALASATLAAPVWAQIGSTMASGTAPVTDSSFVRQAAVSDMYEIQASQLAQTKATSADVKNFATRMITDHTKTSEQLKSIASSKPGLIVPRMLDARHKTLLGRLQSASGASFDSLYAQQQLQAHQEAVMLFTSESQNGKDTDLKKFATDTLPALQQHLSMAQQLPKGGAKP